MTSTISKTLRVLALMMALVMLMPCVAGFSVAANVDDGLLTYEEAVEISTLESSAKVAYSEIINGWMSGDGDIMYPSAYGGSFLNEDNKLSVCLVNGDTELRNEILDLVSDDSILVFISVDASYTELLALKDVIYEDMDGHSISSIAVLERDNVVEVTACSDSSSASMLSRSLSQNPNVRIVYAEETKRTLNESEMTPDNFLFSPAAVAATQNVVAYPGEMIFAGNTDAGGTIGWYGEYRFNGTIRPCILTAGHVVEGLIQKARLEGRDVRYGGMTIQTTSNMLNGTNYADYVFLNQKNEYEQNNGNYSVGDYGFIAYTGLEPTNQVAIGLNLNNATFNVTTINYHMSPRTMLEQSTVLYKAYGKSGFTAGNIHSVRMDIIDNIAGTTIADCMTVTNPNAVFAEEGDSGAPIYYLVDRTPQDPNDALTPVLCGIHNGAKWYDGQDDLFYFTPITTIIEKGFVPHGTVALT